MMNELMFHQDPKLKSFYPSFQDFKDLTQDFMMEALFKITSTAVLL